MQYNKYYPNLLNVKAFTASGRWVDTLKEQHQFIPSQTIKTRLVLPTEHLPADPPVLHPLVIYHIATALPVKQLHQRAAAVEENIHGTIRRLLTGRTDYTAKRLDSLTQTHRIAVDHKLICFIQTKHSKTFFAGAKIRKSLLPQKTSYLGWLRSFYPVFLAVSQISAIFAA